MVFNRTWCCSWLTQLGHSADTFHLKVYTLTPTHFLYPSSPITNAGAALLPKLHVCKEVMGPSAMT
jgi:hypothetical protein